MKAGITVVLNRLGPGTDRRGRVVYLPAEAMIVVAETYEGSGIWRCRILARRGLAAGSHVSVAVADLDGAATTVIVEADTDPDGYAMVWQALASTCRGDRWTAVARALVVWARIVSTIRLELSPGATDRVLNDTHTVRPGLAMAIRRIREDGLLAPTPAGTGGWDAYLLTMPRPGTTTSAAGRLPPGRFSLRPPG